MDINYPLEYWKDFSGPFPQLVFGFKPGGLFAFGVASRTKGMWGHFMWLVDKDVLASQSLWFGRHSIDDYSSCLLKFVHNPSWTDMQRINLLVAINKDLDLSPWETRYDVWGVIGELLGIKWMNRKGLYFCSERGAYLKLVDPAYDLVHPDPSQLNIWTKESGRYEVVGRYAPG
jgi:hypothetical protein